jgi:ABC-type multidrug transport system ATPase subunit
MTDNKATSPVKNGRPAFAKVAQRASVREAVEKREDLTLTWEHLTVHVDQQDTKTKNHFVSVPGTKDNFGLGVDDRPSYNALQRVSGWLTTGKMVLVLSPDQQSASALLQTLSGRQTTGVAGTIAVNGAPLLMDNKPIRQGWQRVMAHVAASDASHAPNLTVRETLTFAAECTAETTTDQSNAIRIINDEVDEVLDVLDLANVADTVVGDEQLRGVSGGQKRRVTIGEM